MLVRSLRCVSVTTTLEVAGAVSGSSCTGIKESGDGASIFQTATFGVARDCASADAERVSRARGTERTSPGSDAAGDRAIRVKAGAPIGRDAFGP